MSSDGRISCIPLTSDASIRRDRARDRADSMSYVDSETAMDYWDSEDDMDY